MDLHATSPQPADPPLRLIQQGSKEYAMTHRSRLAGFIIDCDTGDLDAAASFWSGALGMPVADRSAEGEAAYAELSNTPANLKLTGTRSGERTRGEGGARTRRSPWTTYKK